MAKWGWIIVLILAGILIPFWIWGGHLEGWVQEGVQSAEPYPIQVGLLLGGLLAIDVILPIPSTVVGTTAGLILGLGWGMGVVFSGLMIGSLLGYGVGRFMGRVAIARWVGEVDMMRLEGFQQRWGDGFLILARSIPVLAESSTLFAGIGRIPFLRFLGLMVLSNLGVAGVYVSIGAWFAHSHACLLALGISLALSAVFFIRSKSGTTCV